MDKTPNTDENDDSSQSEREDSDAKGIENDSPQLSKATKKEEGKIYHRKASPRRNVGPRDINGKLQPQALVLCMKCGRKNTPEDLRSIADSQRNLPYAANEVGTSPTNIGTVSSTRAISNECKLKRNVKQEHENVEQNISESEEVNVSSEADNLDSGINISTSESSNAYDVRDTNVRVAGIPKNDGVGISEKRSFDQPERKLYLQQKKREEQLAKEHGERVRKLIEEDKINRKLEFQNSEFTSNPKAESQQAHQQQSEAPKKIRKIYSHTKLLIRLTNGDTLLGTFSSNDSLSSVLLFIEENRTDGDCLYTLRTVYPKRTFTVDEYDLSLAELDLAPASALIVSRKYKISDERSRGSFIQKKKSSLFLSEK